MTPAPGRPVAPIALTMGEPAGIGGDIALLAWQQRDARTPAFFLIDDPKRITALARHIGIEVLVETVTSPDEALSVWPSALPVLSHAVPATVVPGRPDPANAAAVIGSIDEAVRLTGAGEAAALVTNPIQKNTLYAAGFRSAGHTEYLAELTGSVTPPVMLLAVPGLRVALVTIHLPLAEAVASLTASAIAETARIVANGLRQDFALDAPRLAVAGLNPHAGESGALGREEIDIIAPAVATLHGEGLDVSGPYPADTLFHADARARYDAVICMYHDQALIPLKTIDFWNGVNVTLGLPIVRTSPDHGTALDLAGTGKADPRSLLAALRTAREIADCRQQIGKAPLPERGA